MHVRNPCNAARFIHMLMEINAFRPRYPRTPLPSIIFASSMFPRFSTWMRGLRLECKSPVWQMARVSFCRNTRRYDSGNFGVRWEFEFWYLNINARYANCSTFRTCVRFYEILMNFPSCVCVHCLFAL